MISLRVRSIVTSGHDEYWTLGERNAVESALAAGTNAIRKPPWAP